MAQLSDDELSSQNPSWENFEQWLCGSGLMKDDSTLPDYNINLEQWWDEEVAKTNTGNEPGDCLWDNKSTNLLHSEVSRDQKSANSEFENSDAFSTVLDGSVPYPGPSVQEL